MRKKIENIVGQLYNYAVESGPHPDVNTTDDAVALLFNLLEESKLRDEFAKAALTGILASASTFTIDGERVVGEKWFSRLAYLYADAMLKARKEISKRNSQYNSRSSMPARKAMSGQKIRQSKWLGQLVSVATGCCGMPRN